MAIRVHIPTALRHECDGANEVRVAAATVREALDRLEVEHPRIYQSVCDETRAVRRHVNLFVNDECLNKSNGLDAPLAAGDELTIMPAVSGG